MHGVNAEQGAPDASTFCAGGRSTNPWCCWASGEAVNRRHVDCRLLYCKRRQYTFGMRVERRIQHSCRRSEHANLRCCAGCHAAGCLLFSCRPAMLRAMQKCWCQASVLGAAIYVGRSNTLAAPATRRLRGNELQAITFFDCMLLLCRPTMHEGVHASTATRRQCRELSTVWAAASIHPCTLWKCRPHAEGGIHSTLCAGGVDAGQTWADD